MAAITATTLDRFSTLSIQNAARVENSIECAKQLDAKDPLRMYREHFYFPQQQGKDQLYFTGNSLGLQPKRVPASIQQELNDWAHYAVEGHWNAKNPWLSYHEILTNKLAKLVGAKPIEVVAMNGLSVNVHLLLMSFYRPAEGRYKILCEKGTFPSDQYALESQACLHGHLPEDAIVEVGPRPGERLIKTEDILAAIEQHKETLSTVMLGGVNYATGQVLDMKSITLAAHKIGATAGFDLAHAAGNIKLSLHEWDVDFAAWCGYKYLNGGPGGVAGAFVHERHANSNLFRLAGWWGHDKASRFKMEKGFHPIPGAEGWQLSNAPVLLMAALRPSLEIFDEVGMDALVAKSRKLSSYLQFILEEVSKKHNNLVEIITPNDPEQRGCQLSIVVHTRGKELCDRLQEQGVIADWREPDIIRLAPVPLYNSFEDIFRFGQILDKLL